MNALFHLISRRTRPLVLVCAALVGFVPVAQAFVHPGGLHTQADLDRMRNQVAAGAHPWIDGWNRLVADTGSLLSYNHHATANMGSSRQNASLDAHAAYNAVIRWQVSGDTAYADKAVQICNAWSAVVNQVPTGTDIPGLSGIPVGEFAYVGEILRTYSGWAPADFQRFKDMMLTWWYPVCHNFLVNHNGTPIDHYWANWDIANVGAIMAIGVLCDDQAKFDEAVDYFKNSLGNGGIMQAVYFMHPGGLGQWQESGRDQEHAQLGVGMMAAFCEMAWKQGVDLYGYAGNRLLAGAEYVARTNLSRPVPYAPYTNSDSANQYYISINGLGRLDDRPLWELVYNHYVVRMGLSAPNVQAMAQLMRPEHGSVDHFGYGTLTFTLDAAASPYPSAPVPPAVTGPAATAGVSRVMLQWELSAGDTAQGYKVMRATTPGGPYTTLASWTDNTYPQYTDTAVTNGTTYYYVVAANNQSGTGANSPEISATPIAAGAMPDGWARQDVGTVNSTGGASYANASGNTFLVTGNGTGIGGAADSLGYAYRAATGDCTITGRLLTGGSIKVGFMIRETLAANAKTLSLTLGDVGGRQTFFGTRSSTGGNLTIQRGNDYTWMPVWYKLQRAGDTFTASQSLDGVDWHVIGTSSVAMANTCFVGLAVCGGTATFDNLTVDGVFLAGPPVNLSATNGPNQVTLSWSASSGATSYNLKRAITSGGPYTTIATGLTTTSYADVGLPDGSEYYYVVSAVQDAYETVNSGEVQGLPGDIAFNWSATPGSANWSLATNWVDGVAPVNGASLTFSASGTASLNNDLAGLSLNRITFKSGASAFTLAGNAVTLAGNVLNSASTTQTINLSVTLNGTRTINASTGAVTVNGVISGAGSGLVKTGPQPLSLTGQNTFTGDVTHSTGTLSIAGIGTGTAGSPTTGALGRGTLQLGGGLLTSSAAATIFNNIVLQPGTTTSIASNVANLTLAGNISGSGNLTESGTNVGGTHFNGDNSGFTGTFTSSNATNHRVRFNSAAAGSASATWVLNNSQTDGYGLTFNTGTIHFGALSGGGQFRSDSALNTTGTLSIGALNTNTTFTGVMVANSTRFIAVTKVGTGTLTFTGNHTYNGPTTVTGGALYVNGAFASPVTVTGGTFGGTGSSTAALTVGVGGTLAPGNQAIGTFTTTGALTLNANATYACQLNSTTGTADRITAGAATLNNANLLFSDLGSGSLPFGTALTIVNNTGAAAVAGTFNGYAEGALFSVGSNTFRITYQGGTGNDVVLTAVVPPPVITSDASAGGAVGTPFSYAIGATNSPTGFSASGLPPGLILDTASGLITGTPTEAGTFDVALGATNATASVTAPLTLVIARGAATVTLGNLDQTYDGSPKPVTATIAPEGLPVSVTYNGSATIPVNAGSYAVVATVNAANYAGSAAGTLVIGKATATITLNPLQQAYDGMLKPVTATTTPAGLTVGLTYDGATTAPIYPGPHAVVATINEANYSGTKTDTMLITVTVLVRHAPTLGSVIDGSAQMLLTENLSLKGGAALSGDLLLPGTPALQLNGSPTYVGLKDGLGLATPTNSYTLTLGGGAVVRYLVRHVDAIALPTVDAPPAPVGTRDVTLKEVGQTAGDFATLRNLILKDGVGFVAVPAGTYGSFSAGGNGGFVLGVAGATEPAVYNLQDLTLSSTSTLQVAGPVILTLANGVTLSGTAGNAAHPEYLTLRVSSGGVTLNKGATLRAIVSAPAGTVTLNDSATLVGRDAADQLTLNTNALVDDTP